MRLARAYLVHLTDCECRLGDGAASLAPDLNEQLASLRAMLNRLHTHLVGLVRTRREGIAGKAAVRLMIKVLQAED